MQTSTFKDYQAQCTFSDMALFDLLRAVSDLKDCENELTSLDIEHIQVGAKVLNALLGD